jgi:hypothetical protein
MRESAAGREGSSAASLSPARFSRSSIGGLVRALELLLSRNPDPDCLKNQVMFLDPE